MRSALLLCSLVAYAYGQGAGECTEPLQKFVGCVKAEVEAREKAEHEEAGGAITDKAAKCFTSNGCAAPDLTGPLDADFDEKGKQNWKNLTDWWTKTDSDKRYCVIAQIRGNFREKLQECVSKTIPGFSIPPSRDEKAIGEPEKGNIAKLAEFRLRTHMALGKCGDKTKLVFACLEKERNLALHSASCKIRQECAASVSAECQKKWIAAIRTPVCACVSETAQSLKSNSIVDVNGLPLKDEQVKQKCGVDLPVVDVGQVKGDKNLHTRIKSFVALHEDRRISICHECDGVPL